VSLSVSAHAFSVEQRESTNDDVFALLRGDVPLTLMRGNVLFEDAAMMAIRQTVLRVAKTRVPVLVLGETGVGKDVIAAMLHELSPRANRPFLAINCASLPETLLETELFGHERGAFTGAIVAKPGLLEAAEGGTVFFDEIGDLPLALQAKLLRVFESREVTRLGALKPRNVDVRFVAATNRDLARDVSTGRFRQDLYYRMNCIGVTVPPLRERGADIVPLAKLFLESFRFRCEAADVRFSPAALSAMNAHTWPGNVRELKSAVERAAIFARGELIEPKDLGLPTARSGPAAAPPKRPSITQGPPEIETTPDLERERERIVRALEACGGNQSRAVRLLGISRRTLVRKIAALGLPRPRASRQVYDHARDRDNAIRTIRQ
jgi:DNA-binding NtrC family response regulator